MEKDYSKNRILRKKQANGKWWNFGYLSVDQYGNDYISLNIRAIKGELAKCGPDDVKLYLKVFEVDKEKNKQEGRKEGYAEPFSSSSIDDELEPTDF